MSTALAISALVVVALAFLGGIMCIMVAGSCEDDLWGYDDMPED